VIEPPGPNRIDRAGAFPCVLACRGYEPYPDFPRLDESGCSMSFLRVARARSVPASAARSFVWPVGEPTLLFQRPALIGFQRALVPAGACCPLLGEGSLSSVAPLVQSASRVSSSCQDMKRRGLGALSDSSLAPP